MYFMNKHTALIVTIALVLSACATNSSATSDIFPVSPSIGEINSFKIAETEMPVLEKEALYGDSDAALKLYQYSEYVKRDKSESRYWLLMAAQNGSRPAMKRLGDMMQADNSSPRNYLRSNYWLKKAGS